MSRTNINTSVSTKGSYTSRGYTPEYTRSYDRKYFPPVDAPLYTSGLVRFKELKTEARSSLVSVNWGTSLRSNHLWGSKSTHYHQMNNFSYRKEYIHYIHGYVKSRGYPFIGTYNTPSKIITDEGYMQSSSSSDLAWHMANYSLPSASEIDAADRLLKNKLLLKIKDQRINVQQFLAERDQTVRLVTETVGAIASAVRNLKRGNIRGAFEKVGLPISNRYLRKFNKHYVRDQSAAIANGWVKMQYGVRPLLNDVKGAAEFLAQRIAEQKPPIQRVVAVKTINTRIDRKFAINPDYIRNVTELNTCEYTIRYTVYFRQNLSISNLPTQLGLTNPALIVWELMPWSFVVDWFLPVGNFLSSLDATVGLEFEGGCRTVFIRANARKDFSAHETRWGTSSHVIASEQKTYRQKIECIRTTLAGFPSAQIPAFKNPVSTEHMLNALALLRQQFRGRRN